MTILVTGAQGQLGCAITDRFRADHRVDAFSHSELDLTQSARVIDAVHDVQPDVIINCAAYNDVDGAEDDPVEAFAVNTFGVRTLARAARGVGALLVHYSTDFVFDGATQEPYTEADAPNPQSAYAMSKLLGEWFAQDTSHYVLRVESLFGGGALDSPGAGGPRGSSLDRIADAILAEREVQAFSDRTASPSYVRDVADATFHLLASAAPQGLYHCVGSGMATWLELATELALCLDRPARIVAVSVADRTFKARRPTFCALSNAKLARAGMRMPAWQDALRRYGAARSFVQD